MIPMLAATLDTSLGIASVVVLANPIVRTALAPNDCLRAALIVRPMPHARSHWENA